MFRYSSPNNIIVQEALKAAKEVGPHAYKLEGINPDEDLCYIEIGCGGDGSDEQIQVANLINSKIKEFANKGIKIHFLILLGDNIYPNGASSPFDKLFLERIESLYNIKIFCATGNHDAGISITSSRLDKNPREVILNAIAHSYIPEGDRFPTVAAKRKFYEADKEKMDDEEDDFVKVTLDKKYQVKRKTFNLDLAPKNNEPSTCFSLYTNREEIFFIDTNTLAEDFIFWKDWMDDKIAYLDHNNQIPFLIEEIKHAKMLGKKIHLKMHQLPLTTGERSLPEKYDTSHHLYKEQINRVKLMLNTTSDSHNELIRLIIDYISEGKAKSNSGAHDHHMEIYDDNDYFQIVSGGGGSKERQQLVTNQFHPHIKFSVIHHGMVLNRGNQVHIFTTNGLELTYDRAQHQFIYSEKADDKIHLLRQNILTACDNHINALKQFEIRQKTIAEQNKLTAEINPGFISSVYSGFGFFCEKTLYYSKKAIRKFAGYNFNQHREQEIECVYEMKAFFSQFVLDQNKILLYLTEWKIKYGEMLFYTGFKKYIKQYLKVELFPELFDLLDLKNQLSRSAEITPPPETTKDFSFAKN